MIPPPEPDATARLLIPYPDGVEFALAMSRSLGDTEAEKLGKLAEPTTDIIELTKLDKNRHYIAVAVTDGIFDKVPSLEIAQHVARSLLPQSALQPLASAEQLIMKSSFLWLNESMGDKYRDDMTIAVHKLLL